MNRGVSVAAMEKGSKKKNGAKPKAAPAEDSAVSLSALLNVLDGILCPDGLVVIATTNHHTRLDPALIRAGRFDYTFELGKLGQEDFDRMATMFGKPTRKIPSLLSGAEMRAELIAA